MTCVTVERVSVMNEGLTLAEAADALRSELGPNVLVSGVRTSFAGTECGKLVARANGRTWDVRCKDADGWPVDFAEAVAFGARGALGLNFPVSVFVIDGPPTFAKTTDRDVALQRGRDNVAEMRAEGPMRRCVECGTKFDLADPLDAEEWAYGHDCEA